MGRSDEELASELARRARDLEALRRNASRLYHEISRFVYDLDGLADDLAKRRDSLTPSTALPAPPKTETEKLSPLEPAAPPDSAAQPWNELRVPESAQPRFDGAADVESRIGGTWLNRVGAILLLLGVAFFVKYSFEQGWLSPTIRVVLGLATGVVLICVGGWCARRDMRNFAEGVLAAGVAILYASAFGAHSLYHLVDTKTAFGGYVAITAVAAIIAASMGLLGLTVLAIIGAFLTPVAVSTGQNQQVALMNYLLVVDAGFLVVGWIRRWPLRLVLMVATASLFTGWYMQHYDPTALWKTLGYLTAFYIVFHGEALLLAARAGDQIPDEVLFVPHACNAVFFGMVYYLAGDIYKDWMGLFAVTMAIVQFGAAAAVLRGASAHARRALWMDGAAMLALAAPLQWDGYLVCVAWGVHAAVVMWFTRRSKEAWLWIKAAALYIAATAHLGLYDADDPKVLTILSHGPLWNINWLFVLTIGLALTMYAGAAIGARARIMQLHRTFLGTLVIAGCALIMQACANQLDRYAATWCWLILGAAWLAPMRWYSGAALVVLGLVVVAAGKFVVWDLMGAATAGYWDKLHGLVINRAVITGAAVAVSLWLSRVLAPRIAAATDCPEHSKEIDISLQVAAILVLWLTGTFEIPRAFRFEEPRTWFAEPGFAMHVTLSLFWGLSAMAMLIAGFVRATPPIRYTAIVIFALTTIKVLAVDISGLRTVYRIVSFIVVGVLLLIASLVYQRRRPNRGAVPIAEGAAPSKLGG